MYEETKLEKERKKERESYYAAEINRRRNAKVREVVTRGCTRFTGDASVLVKSSGTTLF